MELVTFWALAIVGIVAAVVATRVRNVMYAALSFAAFLVANGFLLILMGADFLGVAQLFVYAGGVAVLLVFGLLLTPRLRASEAPSRLLMGTGAIGAFLLLAILLIAILSLPVAGEQVPDVSPEQIGRALLDRYLLPFELISLVLLVALVGGIVFVERGRRR